MQKSTCFPEQLAVIFRIFENILSFRFFQGENAHLQMELVRIEKVKSNLSNELTKLSAQAEKLDSLTIQYEELQKAYQETEEKYQTMLTVSIIYFYHYTVVEIGISKPNGCQVLGPIFLECNTPMSGNSRISIPVRHWSKTNSWM